MAGIQDNLLMTVAAVCRCNGVTARALRFYEDEGLILAIRDPRNRRLYDAQSRADVALIAGLRRANVPLVEVREVIALRTASGHRAQLDRAAELLCRQLHALEAQTQAISRELRQVVAARYSFPPA